MTRPDDACYDISDGRDIDPRFGSLEEFDALLAGAGRAAKVSPDVEDPPGHG